MERLTSVVEPHLTYPNRNSALMSQSLQDCLSSQDNSNLLALLTAWSQLWSRLTMDNSRCFVMHDRSLTAAVVLKMDVKCNL